VRLTKEQSRAARTRKKRVLVLACAGSGKTRVIEERIHWLVHGTGPKRRRYLTDEQRELLSGIVAFTFTEKAAEELKLRLMARLGALGEMYVGTIHSFCLQRILAQYDPLYRGVVVLDDAARIGLIHKHYRRLGIRAAVDEYLERVEDDEARKQLRWLDRYEQADLFADSVDIVREECILLDSQKRRYLRRKCPAFVAALEAYDELLREEGLIDYSAMQYWAVEMLERHPEIRREVRRRIRHLLVDEFQDINTVQMRLIKNLVGRNTSLFAVGDDDQAIYEWRGASVGYIRRFRQFFRDAAIHTLSCNFRSTDAIVACAREAAELQRERPSSKKSKAIRSRPEATSRRGEVAFLEFEDIAQEAAWIAKRIKELRGAPAPDGQGRGIDWGDFAILLRRKRYVQPYVEALERAGIPYCVTGLSGLDNVPEVCMVLSALEIAAGGGGQADVEEMFLDAATELLGSEAKARRRLDKFLRWWAKRKDKGPGELQTFFQQICKVLGLPQPGDEEQTERQLLHLGQLSGLIACYQQAYGAKNRDLGRLCDFIWYFVGGWEDKRVTPAAEINAVQIMTVHRAKGLEWPAVFVAERRKSYAEHRLRRYFLVPERLFEANRYCGSDEEERRILYVALTRAQQYLHVTWSLANPGKGRAFRADPHVQELAERLNSSKLASEIARSPEEVAQPRKKLRPSPPPVRAHFPATFTQLKYYWRCPADFWLRWMAGFWPPIADEMGFGKQVHALLRTVHERLDRGEEVAEEDLWALAEEHFRLPHVGRIAERRLREAAVELLIDYLQKTQPYSDKRLQPEVPFAYMMQVQTGGRGQFHGLISGQIDLLEFKEGPDGRRHVAVVEFKTYPEDEGPTFNEAVLQAQLYAIGAREGHGLNPREARVELLYDGVAHPVPVDRRSLERVNRKIERALKDIARPGLPKRSAAKGWQSCRSCDFHRICPWRH